MVKGNGIVARLVGHRWYLAVITSLELAAIRHRQTRLTGVVTYMVVRLKR